MRKSWLLAGLMATLLSGCVLYPYHGGGGHRGHHYGYSEYVQPVYGTAYMAYSSPPMPPRYHAGPAPRYESRGWSGPHHHQGGGHNGGHGGGRPHQGGHPGGDSGHRGGHGGDRRH